MAAETLDIFQTIRQDRRDLLEAYPNLLVDPAVQEHPAVQTELMLKALRTFSQAALELCKIESTLLKLIKNTHRKKEGYYFKIICGY